MSTDYFAHAAYGVLLDEDEQRQIWEAIVPKEDHDLIDGEPDVTEILAILTDVDGEEATTIIGFAHRPG